MMIRPSYSPFSWHDDLWLGIRCMAVLSKWWSDVSESSGVGQRWHGLSWAIFFVERKRWRKNTTWCQILEVQSISTPKTWKFISDFGVPPFCQRRSAWGRWNGPSWLASVKVSPFARSCSKDWGNKLQDALSKASKYISSPENRGAESGVYIYIDEDVYKYHLYVNDKIYW